jgi:hypothetical protein
VIGFANPFLDQGLMGAPQPNTADPALAIAAEQHAEEEAVRQGLHGLIRSSVQQNMGKGIETGAAATATVAKPIVQNWLAGGTTTLSSAAVKPAVELGSEATIGSTLGPALGVAAVGYGAYEGIKSGLSGANKLNAAISRGRVDPQEADELRQKNFNNQMVKGGIGSVGGLFGAGPIGALAGGSGGFLGASRTYKDERHPAKATARALAKFMRNPFKK